MTTAADPAVDADTHARAALSRGTSADAVHDLVARAVRDGLGPTARCGVLCDVGCGTGALWARLRPCAERYVGVDAVRYDAFPDADGTARFARADLDAPQWHAVEDAAADVTVSAETIEHLENPRAFFRELRRITRPGGLVVVTTPNQLSWLSLLTLVAKGEFNWFQERPGLYPAHRTALLGVDLLRIAREVGLERPALRYTDVGRVPGTARRWPRGFRGRRFSDNVALVARVPERRA